MAGNTIHAKCTEIVLKNISLENVDTIYSKKYQPPKLNWYTIFSKKYKPRKFRYNIFEKNQPRKFGYNIFEKISAPKIWIQYFWKISAQKIWIQYKNSCIVYIRPDTGVLRYSDKYQTPTPDLDIYDVWSPADWFIAMFTVVIINFYYFICNIFAEWIIMRFFSGCFILSGF